MKFIEKYMTRTLSHQTHEFLTVYVQLQILDLFDQQEFPDPMAYHRRTSAPASLAASRESLLDKGGGSRSSTPSEFINKRYSADLSRLEEIDIRSHGNSGANSSSRLQGKKLDVFSCGIVLC